MNNITEKGLASKSSIFQLFLRESNVKTLKTHFKFRPDYIADWP